VIGQTLSHYRITAALGAGGMGEVYRATDTKLGRDVAIKILPPEVAQDPERLTRFQREAHVLASLNHPHVAAIHGLEEAAGAPFLVLELVEGEDLSERLGRGSIPPEETIEIARQIAEALEEAHEKGIVHRDLKPANVKVRPDGQVKVLDFGLAKAWAGDPLSGSSGDLSQSPTLVHSGTQAGVILGTAAYMSPEQARGRTVDRRADIWAFGALVFEMLTGRTLFTGDTVSDTLAAVLRQEVDWAALPAATPPALRHLLQRCLERDPKQRLRDVGEARIALAGPGMLAPVGPAATAPGAGGRGRLVWPALAACALLVGFALGALGPWRRGSPTPAERPLRTLVLPAAGRTLEDSQAISPDGRWVAYTARGTLWLRNLSGIEARDVPDSEGAVRPFWSPRSDAVAFAAGGRILKVALEGGHPQELCRFSGGEFSGGSWSATEGIVFTLARANWDGDVLRVPEGGGEPQPFAQVDRRKGERRLYDPYFLPDGRSLLYTLVTPEANNGTIAVDRDGVRTLLGVGDSTSQPAWSPPGHVVFTRHTGGDAALWALPFSLGTLAPTGEPFRVTTVGAQATVSVDGTLVYARRAPEVQKLVWVDRTGHTTGTMGQAGRSTLWTPALSPDGRRVAAVMDWKSLSVWDTERGIETRVSSDEERALFASWMPDSDEIAYALGGGGALLVRRADGTGEPRVLLRRPGVAGPSFSADGSYLAFYVVDPETGRDLWAVATKDLAKPFPLLRTPANEALPRISPDNRFVVYQSDASGRWEVYVQPFPNGEGRWQVSVEGGRNPVWNPAGGEIVFVSGNDLMAADVSTKSAFRVGAPHQLFSGATIGTRLSLPTRIESFFDIAPDGRRFVVVQGVGMGTSDVVVAEGLLPRAGNDRNAAHVERPVGGAR
jgi:Tol biopolymer transport system component